MMGVWWFERWGSPIPPPGSDDYHPKHSTTLWCQVFFCVFFWVIAPLESCQLLLRPAERPTMTNEKEPEGDWTCDIQLFVLHTNSSLTNYMAISQCTWACERGEDV